MKPSKQKHLQHLVLKITRLTELSKAYTKAIKDMKDEIKKASEKSDFDPGFFKEYQQRISRGYRIVNTEVKHCMSGLNAMKKHLSEEQRKEVDRLNYKAIIA